MGSVRIRLPYRGWCVKATDKNMEPGPAVPNIEIENAPNYRTVGDRQLKRAADVLLQQLDQ